MLERKEIQPADAGPEFDYLCVDAFLTTLVDARALAAALELGVVDTLSGEVERSAAQLEATCRADPRGLRLLLDLLRGNGVVEVCPGGFRLTPRFRFALAYRDLLEAKLAFARLVLPDFVEGFPVLVRTPAHFVRSSGVFDLFDYSRAEACTPENLEHTRRWIRLTTAWTRYEAGVCMRHHDFSAHRRVLDIGGNSGEFVLRLCRTHPDLQGTVLDLPAVCRIGREHVQGEPEADRITFLEGNALKDDLPEGFDLVSFKSTLHDWPEAEARRLMAKACKSLALGGTLVIFERAQMGASAASRSFAALPFLLFSPWFRSPGFYADCLRDVGFQDIDMQDIALDTPFFLVRGRKGG